MPSYLLVSLANLGPKMFNVTKSNPNPNPDPNPNPHPNPNPNPTPNQAWRGAAQRSTRVHVAARGSLGGDGAGMDKEWLDSRRHSRGVHQRHAGYLFLTPSLTLPLP